MAKRKLSIKSFGKKFKLPKYKSKRKTASGVGPKRSLRAMWKDDKYLYKK